VYHLLLTRLIDANHGDLTDLRRAAKLRDWAGVHRSIHRLKGSAALARCPTLVAAGKSIESAAKYRKAAVVNALLPRYVAIVTEFNDRLRDLRSNSAPRRAAATFKEFDQAVHQHACKCPGTLANCEPAPAAPPSHVCRRELQQFRRETLSWVIYRACSMVTG
jgi:HPt (histidine-containing phosphotransfer) domain-containing protein